MQNKIEMEKAYIYSKLYDILHKISRMHNPFVKEKCHISLSVHFIKLSSHNKMFNTLIFLKGQKSD